MTLNVIRQSRNVNYMKIAPYLLVRNVAVSCVRYTKMVGLIFCYIINFIQNFV